MASRTAPTPTMTTTETSQSSDFRAVSPVIKKFLTASEPIHLSLRSISQAAPVTLTGSCS
jgi:hypothetical protein